ncbi:MAG TPA: LptA/OstA family protein, partial [Rhodopila sp.]
MITRSLTTLAVLLALGNITCTRPARAQMGVLTNPGAGHTLDKSEPITFSADEVDYDKDKALVTATGHVEAWQNGHVMRADKVTFDRNTGVAAATGHVVMLEP